MKNCVVVRSYILLVIASFTTVSQNRMAFI